MNSLPMSSHRELTVDFSFRSSSKRPALTQWQAENKTKKIAKTQKNNKILTHTHETAEKFAQYISTLIAWQVIPGSLFGCWIFASVRKRDGTKCRLLSLGSLSRSRTREQYGKNYSRLLTSPFNFVFNSSHRFKCFFQLHTPAAKIDDFCIRRHIL